MELEVQKYLRSGKTLDDLKENYAIKANINNGLVCLKYNQLDSPKFDRLVRECRGLILRLDSWKVVSQPFYRFLNFGEDPDIAFSDICAMTVLEKMDGSLCTLFYDKDIELWRMSTSGTIDGLSSVHDEDFSFQSLFFDTLAYLNPLWVETIDHHITYVFELTSPYNKIVTPYKECGLTLLTARGRDLHEVYYSELEIYGARIGIPVVKYFNLCDLSSIMESFKTIVPLDEGYVAVDYSRIDEYGNFPRVKIKNPSYVALHSLKNSACNSQRALFGVVLTGEVAEIVSVFPEFEKELLSLSSKWEDWKSRHENWINEIRENNYTPKHIGLNSPNGIHKGLVFSIIKGQCKDINSFVTQNIETRTFKSACKHILQIINEKK